MKSISSIVSLLIVLALGIVTTGCEPSVELQETKVTPQFIETITPIKPFKPTLTPGPTPTVTPVPTPLFVSASMFDALWVENLSEGQGSVIWLTDPRDIGNRREILRFDNTVREAVLSPDGRKLAIVTESWDMVILWVVNVDGSNLQQVEQSSAPGIKTPFWNRDSRLLAYRGVTLGKAVEYSKAGTPVTVSVLQETIELLDTITGEKQRLIEQEPHISFSVLGWSANGQEVYYWLDYLNELWSVNQNQSVKKVMHIKNELGSPPLLLSPSGLRLLMTTPEGLSWISTNELTQQGTLTVTWKLWCGYTWHPQTDEIITCRLDEQQPNIEHINVVNIQTKTAQMVGSFKILSGRPLSPIAISPDLQWLAASLYQNGMYWVHLSTETTVPVHGNNRFVGWLPRGQ